MERKTKILSVLFLICLFQLSSQVLVKSEQELEVLKSTPLETLYIHYSSSVLFPGEYLYFSVYAINLSTYRLNRATSAAYVELIGEDGTKVFSQKILLEKGKGQGDFFLPVSVLSGNYKLIGYTNWMKNAGTDQFFQADISVVNPYRSNASIVTKRPAEESDTPVAVLQLSDPKSSPLELHVDRKVYGKRALVTLTVKNYKGALGFGNYSLSVRKMEAFNKATETTAQGYSESYGAKLKQIPQSVNAIVHIPEQRGELISGKITNSTSGEPVVDVPVGISLPGTDFQTKVAFTDNSGNFYTYISKPYKTEQAVLQVMQEGDASYSFEMAKLNDAKFTNLDFHQFTLDASHRKAIERRSIHNQIENAFFEAKPDTLKTVEASDPFDGQPPLTFVLDEYTRFPTLRETLVEIVEHVWVKKEGKDSYTFWVREPLEPLTAEYTEYPPLVTIDGVLIPDHNKILDFDARIIERIHVLRDRFALGGKNYHGMVALETVNANYMETVNSEQASVIPLLKPTPAKNYFQEMHEVGEPEGKTRIPDYRYQLYWQPAFEIESPEKTFQFYTSDVEGAYIIRLEGFTTYGKPISMQKTIEVQ